MNTDAGYSIHSIEAGYTNMPYAKVWRYWIPRRGPAQSQKDCVGALDVFCQSSTAPAHLASKIAAAMDAQTHLKPLHPGTMQVPYGFPPQTHIENPGRDPSTLLMPCPPGNPFSSCAMEVHISVWCSDLDLGVYPLALDPPKWLSKSKSPCNPRP